MIRISRLQIATDKSDRPGLSYLYHNIHSVDQLEHRAPALTVPGPESNWDKWQETRQQAMQTRPSHQHRSTFLCLAPLTTTDSHYTWADTKLSSHWAELELTHTFILSLGRTGQEKNIYSQSYNVQQVHHLLASLKAPLHTDTKLALFLSAILTLGWLLECSEVCLSQSKWDMRYSVYIFIAIEVLNVHIANI